MARLLLPKEGSADSESGAKEVSVQSYYSDVGLRKLIQSCLSFRASEGPEGSSRDA